MVQLAFDDWACRGNRHQKDRDIHHREASLRCKCKVNVAHVRKITIIAHFPKQPPKRDFTVTRPGSSSIPTTITGKSRTYHSGLVSETRWGVKKASNGRKPSDQLPHPAPRNVCEICHRFTVSPLFVALRSPLPRSSQPLGVILEWSSAGIWQVIGRQGQMRNGQSSGTVDNRLPCRRCDTSRAGIPTADKLQSRQKDLKNYEVSMGPQLGHTLHNKR